MNSSNLNIKQLRTLSRFCIFVVMAFVATLIAGCGGGLFGTNDGGDSDTLATAPDVNASDSEMSGPDVAGTPVAAPDANVDGTEEAMGEAGADSQSLTLAFSNSTPSGIDPDSSLVPALKLINLTEATATVSTVEQSVSVSSQGTSELLGVNIGETVVNIGVQNGQPDLISIMPLNAVADSITTLVVQPLNADSDGSEQNPGISLLALDTRGVASTVGMADVRVVSTESAESANASQALFTLSPVQSSSSGTELVLSNANMDNPSVGAYTLANAGEYLLSSSDSGFTPLPVTLLADVVYTIVVTGNSSMPVYLEVDSL
ncbi:MAG: hypothetical protein AB8B97_13455 [Granulosicoccus sp.]